MRLTHSGLSSQTTWTSHSPGFSSTSASTGRPLRCCFSWLHPYTTHKVEPISKPCVLLRYSLIQSAYLCLDLTQNCVYTCQHVRFDETKSPFQSLFRSTAHSASEVTPSSNPIPTIIHVHSLLLIDLHTLVSPASSMPLCLDSSPTISAQSSPFTPSTCFPQLDVGVKPLNKAQTCSYHYRKNMYS